MTFQYIYPEAKRRVSSDNNIKPGRFCITFDITVPGIYIYIYYIIETKRVDQTMHIHINYRKCH